MFYIFLIMIEIRSVPIIEIKTFDKQVGTCVVLIIFHLVILYEGRGLFKISCYLDVVIFQVSYL